MSSELFFGVLVFSVVVVVFCAVVHPLVEWAIERLTDSMMGKGK